MQSLQQFLHNYPFILPITIILIFSTYSIVFGPWAQLTKHYKYSSKFIGQMWPGEIVVIHRNKGQSMTIGINSVGLYLQPGIPLRWLQSSILIPWTQFLEVEKDERWVGTFFHLRSTLQPRIKITIKDALFDKMSAAAGGHLPFKKSSKMRIEMESSLSGKEKSPSKSGKLTLQKKLIAKIFAITFLIGLILGLMNHGIARYQVFQNSYKYQIYMPGQYKSPEYGEVWPDAFMEFLGLSKPIYVKVEQNKGEVISETFYSIFGSMTVANYVKGKWEGAGGSVLSSPLYMTNCVVPLALGWLCIIILPIFGQKKLTNPNSYFIRLGYQLFTIAVNSSFMGFVNYLSFYLTANGISVLIRLALGMQIRNF
jgi:hypothetical protein